MKNIASLVTALALVAAPAAQAAFQEVRTFATGDTTGITLATNPAADAGGNGSITVVPDPDDAENNVLRLNPGTFANGTATNNVWFTIPIPEVTGKATLFTRYRGGPLVDIVWGTTWKTEPTSYGDFSTIARVELDTILDYYNADTYVEVTNGATTPNTWYNVWFVIDVPSNTYDLWVQGGSQWVTPTRVAAGAGFRAVGNDPQRLFMARMTTGDLTSPKAVDPTFFDDIYIDLAGENVTVPGEDPGPVDNGTGRMVNISTRGQVGTGGEILIGGFVVTEGSRRVLIRAVGPTLAGAPFNLGGTLSDPQLSIFPSGSNTPIATNDNWGDNAEVAAAAAASGAFPLAAGSADAAMVMMLEPGGYTVQVSGANGATGVALVEVYQVADAED